MPLREKDVFINCPYDGCYNEMFTALVFAVHALGFVPRCAWESAEGDKPRLENIQYIIAQCRFGIHDLSRNAYDPESNMPRFNIPFELGFFKGYVAADGETGDRHCLIIERNDREYLKYFSDLAGHDVLPHENNVEKMVTIVRDWLRKASGDVLAGGLAVWKKYLSFSSELDEVCQRLDWVPKERLIFVDLSHLAKWWLEESEGKARSQVSR